MVPVLGFCGASQSGKTTLLCGVIAELKRRGYRVGAIKHHGKADPLPAPEPHKDSARLALAGAERVALAHAGGVFLTIGPDLATLGPRALAEQFLGDMDLVLVEGYKSSDIDKIEVVAPGKEPILPKGGRILALARRGGGGKEAGLTVLDADDPGAMADFVAGHLKASPAAGPVGPKVRIALDGRELTIKPFVARLFDSTLRAMLHSLKGVEKAKKIEVRLG